MTETTSTTGPSRPRPWLLILLGVVATLAAVIWVWPGNPAGPVRRSSNARAAPAGAQDASLDPAALDVRLEALEARNGGGPDGGRNPFRFQPKPPPPAPPPPPVDIRPVPGSIETGPTGPPPPPPIPLKFIGIVEPTAGDRVAAFSDCRITTYAREGGILLGQYRLVRIGVESVVMEYLDGRGRTTIRLQGQECVGK
jgi:hypothetical protein